MGNKSSSGGKSSQPSSYKIRTPKAKRGSGDKKSTGFSFSPKAKGRTKSAGFSSVDWGSELNLTFTTSDEDEGKEITRRLQSIEETYGENVVEALRSMLHSFYPGVSIEVLLRFAANSPKTAVDDYTAHLTWREANPLMTDHDTTFYPVEPADFPQTWMEKGGVAKDGSKIIFVQGAMYDKALAPVDKWVERTTHVIDSIFPVDSTAGLVSVFIDCRPYKGMKNPPAQQLLGFFKAVQQVCYANYPGRISKVVIYPIPTLLVGLINVVKRMFTKEVREKLIFLGGSGSIGSKCPKKLWDYIEDASELPEASRINHSKQA
ncbi:hypothetical protein TrST_g10329 [Triparma strigata]|uniref:CRAL-TRIO domain-containing protein n=1 Tax=Triparma strigata TaxID=1606541 RepID=A0A9W7AVN8_9STRA|nr:hypothetical protein TrST_g10329 [Triparma strigata]